MPHSALETNKTHVRVAAFVLCGIVVGATALRVVGLDWNLRHEPHSDEGVFVYNVSGMLTRGDLDHRYYEYPALFFYLLLPVLALLDPHSPGAPEFLAARALVASFGVLNVALVYFLAKRYWAMSVWGALAAAAFVAVSPVGVQTAHMVRPDVVLATFALISLWVFAKHGPGAHVAAGVALGAATAVKFTGVLLVAPLVADRLINHRPKLRPLLISGGVAVATFFVLTPYAALHASEFLDGALVQWTHHYQGAPADRAPYVDMALAYMGVWSKALGLGGALLASVGLVLARARWKEWLPWLMLPVATVAVMGSSELRFDRHMVPSFGVLALLAALPVDALAKSRPALAGVTALVALAFPLSASIAYVDAVRRPSTRDRALDAIEESVPDGSRIALYIRGLGLDRRRVEVIDRPAERVSKRLHAAVDYAVAWDGRGITDGLESIFVAKPRSVFSGAPITLAKTPRREGSILSLEDAAIDSSEHEGELSALTDRDLNTFWRTRTAQRPGDFITIHFAKSTTIERVELVLGTRARRFARALHVFVTPADCGEGWRRVRIINGRAPVDQQVIMPSSQLLLLEPVRTCGLRLVQAGKRGKPWGLAELRIRAPASP